MLKKNNAEFDKTGIVKSWCKNDEIQNILKMNLSAQEKQQAYCLLKESSTCQHQF